MRRNIALMIGILTLASSALAQTRPYDPFASGPATPRAAIKSDLISSVEFVDTPITTVFKMISDMTGWSIVMSPDVSAKPPKINLWVKNLTPEQVLDEVATLGELVVDRKGNTIKILKIDEYARIQGVEKQVIELKYARAKDVVDVLKPYINKEDQARLIYSESANRVILIVPKPLLASLLKLVEALDIPLEKDAIEIIPLKHLEADAAVTLLQGFLKRSNAGGLAAPATPVSTTMPSETIAGQDYLVTFMPVPRLNAIVLRGLASDVVKTKDLVLMLDVPDNLKVASYQLKRSNARDLVTTLQNMFANNASSMFAGGRSQSGNQLRLVASDQNNVILAEGTEQQIQRLSKMVENLDQPLPPGAGAVRIYRLDNTTSAKVVAVLQSLIQGTSAAGASRSGITGPRSAITRVGSMMDNQAPGSLPGTPNGYPPSGSGGSGAPGAPGGAPNPGAGSSGGAMPGANPGANPGAGGVSAGAQGPEEEPPEITEAPEINAVIIKASPAQQEEFSAIIRELDMPREQVLLEVTLVTVRSDHNFSLGVEVGGSRAGDTKNHLIGFTNFGISSIDPATGALSLVNTLSGGNGAIINTNEYSVVLNALKTVGDTRVTSSPRLVVEDNATAQINQTSQEPYQIVEQGQTSTSTGLGGYVEAGTLLQVLPHITRDQWLRLEYSVSLSTFGTRDNASLPPPKTQNDLTGTVRIPAEHTVVLGGLVGTQKTKSLKQVPLLGDIPGLGELFKNRENQEITETLFVFIHPVVLKDLAFRDLLFISDADRKKAELETADYPSNPLKEFPSRKDGAP